MRLAGESNIISFRGSSVHRMAVNVDEFLGELLVLVHGVGVLVGRVIKGVNLGLEENFYLFMFYILHTVIQRI